MIVGLSETFRSGTFEEKQEALSALGSNLTLKTKKLLITNKDLFTIISRGLLEAKSHNEAFEPRKCEADKVETDTFVSVRPALLPEHEINIPSLSNTKYMQLMAQQLRVIGLVRSAIVDAKVEEKEAKSRKLTRVGR